MTRVMGDAAFSSALIRQDVLPLAVGYALLMAALAAGLMLLRRRPAVPGPGPSQAASADGAAGPVARGWLRLVRHVAGTAAGGYLLLMAVVVGYYFGVARVSGNFIESAFTGCALLIGLSSPVFAAATWLVERRRPNGNDP
jgi:Family of unknown function (DUF6256)